MLNFGYDCFNDTYILSCIMITPVMIMHACPGGTVRVTPATPCLPQAKLLDSAEIGVIEMNY